MNVIKEIKSLNTIELHRSTGPSASWHSDYASSSYIYYGGLSFDLTEGDVFAIFEQYGKVVDIQLVRDQVSGKSKGFGFLAYEDQRSTVLAVDNLSGVKVLGRTLRVDHCKNYRPPKEQESQKKKEPNSSPSREKRSDSDLWGKKSQMTESRGHNDKHHHHHHHRDRTRSQSKERERGYRSKERERESERESESERRRSDHRHRSRSRSRSRSKDRKRNDHNRHTHSRHESQYSPYRSTRNQHSSPRSRRPMNE